MKLFLPFAGDLPPFVVLATRFREFRSRNFYLSVALFILCGLAVIVPTDFTRSVVAGEDFSKLVEEDVATLQERIHAVARLPNGNAVESIADQPVILWVERCFIGSNDVFSGEGFRYVVLRVSIGNRTEKDLVVQRDKISLKTESRSWSVGPGTSQQFRNSPLEIDWTPEQHPRPQTLLETPRSITVRPGKSTSIWTVFYGMDSIPAIPSMVLQVQPESGEMLTLDVNAQQNARLGFVSETLGPLDCLTVLSIHGQLNRVNSAFLAERIQEVQKRGGQRILIEWGPEAGPSDEVLFNWLATTDDQERMENPLLTQLPPLPALRHIGLCQVPEENLEGLQWERAGDHLYPTTQAGAAALLKEVFERAPVQTVLRELRQGHPWSQRAALQIAARRLGSDAYPLLLELAQKPDLESRREVILALGFQPQATSYLDQLLYGNDPTDAELALEALAATASSEGRKRILKELTTSEVKIPRRNVLKILAKTYHPDWDPYLISCVSDSNPDVRRTALEVLQQLGHADLDQLCITALGDTNDSVSQTAFQVLKQSTHPAARHAALTHTMKQLKEQQTIPLSGLSLIDEMKETSAAPLLIGLLKKKDGPRVRYIEVIGQIGTDEHCRQVLELLETFEDDEQIAALELAVQLPLDVQLATAKRATTSKSRAVREGAIEILRQLSTDEAVRLLGQMISTSDDELLTEIAFALSEIGTKAAIQQLRQFRTQAQETKNARRIQIAESGLREWKHRLPGWNLVENGNLHVMSNEFDEAIKAYTLALTINSELAEAYSMRANTHLRRDEFDQAGKDFNKALELDPDDSQAVTGVAIVQAIQGDWEKAVQFVKERADQFPHDRFFPYNMACVYARAIESIRKSNPELSLEQKQKILDLQNDALTQLKVSMSLGFNQFDWMKVDPDLASIRDLEEFKRLLKGEL